jgi:arsenate reductase
VADAFPITIYHNPDCGTSRNALAMIEAAGYRPEVIEYLKIGWTRPLLERLLQQLDMKPRQLLRENGTSAAEKGLTAPSVSADSLIEAMLADPVLVNRPIVVTPMGTRLCRPSEVVLELLEWKPESFRGRDRDCPPAGNGEI